MSPAALSLSPSASAGTHPFAADLVVRAPDVLLAVCTVQSSVALTLHISLHAAGSPGLPTPACEHELDVNSHRSAIRTHTHPHLFPHGSSNVFRQR